MTVRPAINRATEEFNANPTPTAQITTASADVKPPRGHSDVLRHHMAPAIGLEPITCRLTGGLYVAELARHRTGRQCVSPAFLPVMGLRAHCSSRAGTCRGMPLRPWVFCGIGIAKTGVVGILWGRGVLKLGHSSGDI